MPNCHPTLTLKSALLFLVREKKKSSNFLWELNDETYGTVCSQIIQKEPVPKVKLVLAQICKEQRHKYHSKAATMEDRGGTGMEFTAVKLPTTQTITSTCSHCHHAGYEMENYFQFVGFPNWWLKIHQRHRSVSGHGVMNSQSRGKGRLRHGRGNGGMLLSSELTGVGG